MATLSIQIILLISLGAILTNSDEGKLSIMSINSSGSKVTEVPSLTITQ